MTQTLEKHRSEIDAALDKFTSASEKSPSRLTEAIRYSLLSQGKRLRPILTLLACELCGGESQRAVPAACSVEMIHCYSLIHDDLPAMDDDDLRRGIATCHKKFDEATAILAGDALQALAFELLASQLGDDALSGRCCAALAKAVGAQGLVGGQIYDMYNSDVSAAEKPLERLKQIHAGKTGALISVSLELGALIAFANDEQKNALIDFGQLLGLAFQITDDILDVTGDPTKVGKKLQKDESRAKLTYPNVLGLEASLQHAAETIQKAKAALRGVPWACENALRSLVSIAESLQNRET